MNSKVKVVSDIVISTTSPEWGYIRVEQLRMMVDDRGFARKRVISAIINGKVEDLKSFGWSLNQEIDGKIVIKERTIPFNANDPERDYKVAGETGIVCCYYGEPIYRRHFYTTNMQAHDETIEHTNGDDIKAAYAELKEQKKSTLQGDINNL